MTLEEVLKHEESFRYQLLNRLQMDCQSYISRNGGTRLWGITVEEHIRYMKAIWKSFDKKGKPRWLKYGQILEYEKIMLGESK